MKYLIETKQNKKIGIFSDLHVGVSSDSKIRLNETRKCVDWIIKKFKEEYVDYIIFCGDLFNSRYSVNVNTLNNGIEIVEALSINFEQVFLIVGNHDIYYKNSNEINSVSFLEKVSENDNVHVISNEPKFLNINDVKFGLYPWAYNIDDIKNIENFELPTFGFGHFELNGIELVGSISSGSKYNLKDMFALGKIIFSGHYHGNKVYKTPGNDKNFLYMIGSPLQLDWGDYNKEKKIVILDTDNEESKEYTNNVNARFEKVFYSDFIKEKYDSKQLYKLCHHNFVKFVIDQQYNLESILKFSGLIKDCDPFSMELDYLISISNGIISESAEELIKAKSKTNKDYLFEYLNYAFPEYQKIDDSLDLNYLIDLGTSYFNKALMTDAERKQEEGINNEH